MPKAKNLTQNHNFKFWQIVRESASLASPGGRFVAFSLVLVILSVLPTDKLYYLPVRSIYQSVFGVVTYSSGMTRGLSAILHGNFEQAWNYNPLSFVVFITIVVILIADIRKLRSQF